MEPHLLDVATDHTKLPQRLQLHEPLADHSQRERLDRDDEIVEFEPLTREQIVEIVELQLRRLRER